MGEVWWYNPLVPAIVAALSRISGWSLEHLYTQGGAYLNLLAPIAFYLVARALVGPWPAVASLLAYLFLFDPALGSMHQATYSPWLYPFNFVQGLTFLTLLYWQRAEAQRSLRRYAALGALLGLTFLGHTAPAVIIGLGLVLAKVAQASRRGERPGRCAAEVVISASVALAIASVFILPILLRYQFRIVNADPSSLAISGGRALVRDVASLRGAVSLLGGWIAARRVMRAKDETLLPFAAALVATCILLAYSLVAQRVGWTGIVPSFHFHLYLTAFGAVLFGQGVATISATVDRVLRPRSIWVSGPRVMGYALALVLAANVRGYGQWVELTAMRASSLRVDANAGAVALYEWLSKQPRRGSVLTPIGSSLWVAGAGHPVVLAFPTYSNPYVRFETRERTANELTSAWQHADASRFAALAARNNVAYVVVDSDQPPPVSSSLVEVFRANGDVGAPGPEPFTACGYDGFPPAPWMQGVRVFLVGPVQDSQPKARAP